MKRPRTYSPATLEAAELLGARIRERRLGRRWTMQNLADRIGVTPVTVHKIEHGDPSVGLGLAFEAAALVGVPLFDEDPRLRAMEAQRASERLAVLPRSARALTEPSDDF